MTRFWNYYDDLQKTNPTMRFALFMVLAVFCQVIVPVGLKWGADVDLGLGQVIGIVIMACVAWVRHLSMGNRKHRTLLICISVGVTLAVCMALYIKHLQAV